MPYSILFRPAARRELAELQKSDQRRVLTAIEKLSGNPRPPGCAKLSGFRNVWRIRI